MSASQNQPSSPHKIIIGIDYGTTFSDKSDIDDIHIISSWPGEQHAMWKTPTRIAYAHENPQIQRNKWGFEVDPKLISYSWTKLLLDKNAAVGEHDDPALSKMAGSGMLQLPAFRKAAGVCEDFLHEVYVHVSGKLRLQMTDLTYESTPMECWITLPAIWSDEAKDSTLIAAKKAGFGNRCGDEVFTIAEPEAAAIATLKKFSGPNALNAIKANENILICDCGGGTVDITTYVINQVSPRLEFDELHIGVGGKCGSTYIDRNLHTLLSKRFGSSFDNIAFAQKGPGSRFMISFEKHKRDFGRNDDRDILEIGPIRLEVPDSEHYDEVERMVKLTYEDMQTLFDPVVSEITNLVGQQVKEAKLKKNANIDRVILVGGFAESPYLNNVLEDWCWQNGDITLICPEYPQVIPLRLVYHALILLSQAAVVRGAALRGLEGIAPRMKHGDEVVKGTFRTAYCSREYFPDQENIYENYLYSSSLVDAPEYSTHPRVDKVGVIKSTFGANFDYGPEIRCKSNSEGKLVHQFSYEIQVVFGDKGSNLTFKVIVGGRVVSTADIEFDQR
ncbi:related to hsp70 protein [Phialocephala subalpina]|uniref:Related to hsp70 protein n=1 Tax=Phialocephala subalpina TaxID=576137 RepID=A0A1L7XQX5_9HELO|nr:related to hsp70 protein [Phialocephala subalpina]